MQVEAVGALQAGATIRVPGATDAVSIILALALLAGYLILPPGALERLRADTAIRADPGGHGILAITPRH